MVILKDIRILQDKLKIRRVMKGGQMVVDRGSSKISLLVHATNVVVA